MASRSMAAYRGRVRWAHLSGRPLFHLLALAGAIAMVFPFVWVLFTSLKSEQEAVKWPTAFLPTVWHFDNYARAWAAADFARYTLNTFIMAAGVTILVLLTCSLSGYAFARLSFPGKDRMFAGVLSTLMIPWPVTLVPTFIMIARAPLLGGNNLFGQGGQGLTDTYWGLILPNATTAYGIFLLRQFFKTLPVELEDAARVDSASEVQILWHIMLPLSGPALAVLGLFTFQAQWNSFVWPLVITTSLEMRTLQLGLAVFSQQFTVSWTLQMASTIIAALPLTVVFLLGQRYFIRGIVITGLK
jgi:multiple sugar transport system permease protein